MSVEDVLHVFLILKVSVNLNYNISAEKENQYYYIHLFSSLHCLRMKQLEKYNSLSPSLNSNKVFQNRKTESLIHPFFLLDLIMTGPEFSVMLRWAILVASETFEL